MAANSRAHDAGVCCVHSSPHEENVLFTGSYDEMVRVWDTRRLKSPMSTVSAGGGVWRIKSHPSPHLSTVLLCAAMHGGFAVVHRGQDGTFDGDRTVQYRGGHDSLGCVVLYLGSHLC